MSFARALPAAGLLARFAFLALFTLLTLLAACSSSPPQPAPESAPPPAAPPEATPARLTPEQATDVTLYAVSLVGTPYVLGGNTPEGGFDCSGLIAYVYKMRAHLKAPRTVATLADWGSPIRLEQLQSGDLVLFLKQGVATHAGIYVGEGRFVHAPSAGGTVRLDHLDSGYWARQSARFRRP